MEYSSSRLSVLRIQSYVNGPMKTCALLSLCVKNQITLYETHSRVGAVALQIRVLTQIEYPEYHAQFWSPHHKSIKLNWKNLEKDPGL